MNGGLRVVEKQGPREGELVVCTVTSVKENGAYVSLDTYPGREGFIFIGEIASGWVKNIRSFVRDGQRLVCKVMRTRRDGRSLEMSLKSVSEERKRDTLQAWKNETRAAQLLRIVGEKVGWTDEDIESSQAELTGAFGTLYGSFEESAIDETALEEAGFEGEWIPIFIETAVENIIPPFVEIRGFFELQVENEDGIEVIREALLAAEEYCDEEAEVKVECFYDGAPLYRVELRAPDYQIGETTWESVNSKVLEVVKSGGGTATSERR